MATTSVKKEAWIKVPSWARYNHRKDIEKTIWFRMENDMLENAKFNGFSPGEMITWVYILSQCSQAQSDIVLCDLERLQFFRKVPLKEIWSAIAKLSGPRMKVIEVLDDPIAPDDVTSKIRESGLAETVTLHPRDVDVTPTLRACTVTNRQTDKQTNRESSKDKNCPPENKKIPDPDPVFNTNELINKGDALSVVDNSTSGVDKSSEELENSSKGGEGLRVEPVPEPEIDADTLKANERLMRRRVEAGLTRDGKEKHGFGRAG